MDQAAFRAMVNAPATVKPVASQKAATKISKPAFKPRAQIQAKSNSTAYRDRASERRYHAHDAEDVLYSKLDYETSKFVGGDLEHTHLVKGLDFALLAKLRDEEAGDGVKGGLDRGVDDELDIVADKVASHGASTSRPLGSAWAQRVLRASFLAHPASAPGPGDVEVPAVGREVDGRWGAGRTTFTFTLCGIGCIDEDPDALPAINSRAADDVTAEAPGMMIDRLNGDVAQRVADAVVYIRTGKRVKRAAVHATGAGLPSVPASHASSSADPVQGPDKQAHASDDGNDDDIFSGVGKYEQPAGTASDAAVGTFSSFPDDAGGWVHRDRPAHAAAVEEGPSLVRVRARAAVEEEGPSLGPGPLPAAGAGEEDADVYAYPDTDAQFEVPTGPILGAPASAFQAYPDTDSQYDVVGPPPPPPTVPRAVIDQAVARAEGFHEAGLAEWDAAEAGGGDTLAEEGRKVKEEAVRRYVEGEGGEVVQAHARDDHAMQEELVEEEGEEEDSAMFGATGSYLQTARAEVAIALKGATMGKMSGGRGTATSRAGSGGFSVLIADDDVAGLAAGGKDAFDEAERTALKKNSAESALASFNKLKAGKGKTTGAGKGRFDALGEGAGGGGAGGVGVGGVRSSWNARRFGDDEEEEGVGGRGEASRKRAKLDTDLTAINKLMEERKKEGSGFGFESVVGKGASAGAAVGGKGKAGGKRKGYDGGEDE